MKYYEFRLDDNIRFKSFQKIDYPAWKPKMKLLTDFDIIMSLSSKVCLRCDSDNIYLEPGEAFLSYPGQTIYVSADTEPRKGVYILHFTSGHFRTLSLQELANNGNTVFVSKHIKLEPPRFEPIIKMISDELKYRSYGYEKKLDICMIDLLFELHRSSAEKLLYEGNKANYTLSNIHSKKIIHYLHANYMNRINSSDVEKEVNLNYNYANAIFKGITGFTIMNYLEHIRITRAKEYLASTTLKVSEIAVLVGISDPHYFCKKFKRIEGVSPSRYRESNI